MILEPSRPLSALLFKGGPTLIDLAVDTAELRITITGPRMLFDRLQLLTTLSAFDGCTSQRLRELAESLEATVHCGTIGIQHTAIRVESLRSGSVLQIDLGPASLYQSELVLRSRTGETFRALLSRLLTSDASRPFFAGLHGVPATGHLEHHHGGGGESGQQGGGHDGHP
ncbi:MAG: hypothetical protein JXB05_30320 [Myxococcaceae bacterium]|nr:hypothetical protein [Myxococcaceae bacterium]